MKKKQIFSLFLSLTIIVTVAISLQTAKADSQQTEFFTETSTPHVNVPYFSGAVDYDEMAVFWFGQVSSQNSYADIRIGYNDDHVRINIAVIDRYLWYDPNPGSDLDNHDAITILLDSNHNGGSAPKTNDLKILTQFTWWEEERPDWEIFYLGDGVSWVETDLGITTTSGWRGTSPNDNGNEDKGWVIDIRIPYSALGLSGKPADGTVWGLGAVLHDRDSAEPAAMSQSYSWPVSANADQPSTWGDIVFNPPAETFSGTITGQTTIQQGLNGATVPDGHVGGYTMCGQGLDYWNQWGDKNYAGEEFMNIQNQSDVSDYPCFSKYYVKFPTTPIPAGKSIVSAKLVMHQFGNSDPGQAQPSMIQVHKVSNEWNEGSLTWNNAPYALENIASTWVNPLIDFPGWPGVAHEWDVTAAVVNAYANGTDISFGLYSADGARHSGKYFVSSDTPDWNREARPTLVVEWEDSTLLPPSLIAPSGIISTPSPFFEWLGISGATHYQLDIQENGISIFLEQFEADSVCNGDSCNYQSSISINPGSYSWRIQPKFDDIDGTISSFLEFSIEEPAFILMNKSNSADFNQDGKSDPSKFYPSTGILRWKDSVSGVWENIWLGSESFVPVVDSDFDGDGATDPGKFHSASGFLWWISSATESWNGVWLGSDSYQLVTSSDFDGDGKTDPAKFYPENGTVWWLNSQSGIWSGAWLGSDSFEIISGSDFDGDGKTDPAKFYSSTGTVWWLGSQSGIWSGVWLGSDSFEIISGSDFDGDGKTDPAKYYPENGTIWWLSSVSNNWQGLSLGSEPFILVTGSDIDGDGKDDPGKFIESTKYLWWQSSKNSFWMVIDLKD